MRTRIWAGVAALPICLWTVAAVGNAPPIDRPVPAPRPLPRPVPQPQPVPPVADRAPAADPPGVKYQMTIEARDDINESRLQIPRSLVEPKKGALNAPRNEKAASGLQMAMAGVALSLALGFGGLWLARSGRVGSHVVRAMALAAVLTGVGGALVFADVAPDRPIARPRPIPQPQPAEEPRPMPKIAIPPAVMLSGPVFVEIVDDAKEVKLIVNRKMLARLGGVNKAEPAQPVQPGGPLIPVQPVQPGQPEREIAPQPQPRPVPLPKPAG